MRKKMLVMILLILCWTGGSISAQEAAFNLQSKAAVLYCHDAGTFLYEFRAEDMNIPASLVKIMTMYVALDQVQSGRVSLTDMVVVSEKAWRMTGSQMFLEIGERVSVKDLLLGISVVSGNDATVAIAEALAGSEELFVRWMNDKAKELGLNLTFVDVHGLSPENSVTARDMVLLASNYIKDHPEALEYHKMLSYGYQPRSQNQPIVQNNRNGLLWRFDGTDGLKTGFLSLAGYNLLATSMQNGRRLMALVLGSTSERARENEVVTLLNYGYRNFERKQISELLPKKPLTVYKGKERTVEYIPAVDYVTVPIGDAARLVVELTKDIVIAPVTQGDVVGRVSVTLDGTVIKETSLLALEDVEKGSFFRSVVDSVILFFSNLFSRP